MVQLLIENKDLIEVGKISKIFGINGEVIAIDYAKDYVTFTSLKEFYIYVKEAVKVAAKPVLKKFDVEKFRGYDGKIILKLNGVSWRVMA